MPDLPRFALLFALLAAPLPLLGIIVVGGCPGDNGGDGDGDGDGDGGAPVDAGEGEPDAGSLGSSDGGTSGDGDGGPVFSDAGVSMPDAGSQGPPDGGLGEPDAGSPGSLDGDLDVEWIHGSADCSTNDDPEIQVHAYRPDTYILRQNACINFEAPFMYLLLGEEAAFLQDTGATSDADDFPIRAVVEDLVNAWATSQGKLRTDFELYVTHSHSHGDHVAGDGQFASQPATTLVGTSTDAVKAFFGIDNWPNDEVTFDIGNRVLDIVGIPGHQNQSIAVYDNRTGLLLTGDSLYPGNLFISSWNTYRDSISRLRAFAQTHPPTHILGTHIEMTSTPGVAYPYPNVYQPNERALPLDEGHLIELDEALGPTPQCEVRDDFIINPGGC